jgi:hypothetical protein
MIGEYVKRVLSKREQFNNIKLGYKDTSNIKKIVLKSLNLKTMFELRDRYEGEAFLKSFSSKIKGVIALEKVLEVNIIDWDNLIPKDYTPRLDKIGLKIDVITSEDGKFPIIERISKRPAIITNLIGIDNVWVCGYASVDVLNNNQSDKCYSGMMNRELKTAFIGYDKLIKFSSLEELSGLE